MSQAEELLDSITENDTSLYTAEPETEPHIVIGSDRFITVPDMLKRIAVQFDHNIETVTFDCPRYWDGHDISEMKVFVNYMRADGFAGSYYAETVIIDENDSNIIHFDWTIKEEVTLVKGALSFLVCIKKTDDNGILENHWNSELNKDMYISAGMNCQESIINNYPDIVTDLLTRMENVESVVNWEEVNRLRVDIDTMHDVLVETNTKMDIEKKNLYDYVDLIVPSENGKTAIQTRSSGTEYKRLEISNENNRPVLKHTLDNGETYTSEEIALEGDVAKIIIGGDIPSRKCLWFDTGKSSPIVSY